MKLSTCKTGELQTVIWKNVQPSGPHDYGCGNRRPLDLIVPRSNSAYDRLAECIAQSPALPLLPKQDRFSGDCVTLPEGTTRDIRAISDFGGITPCIATLKSCRAAVVGAAVGASPIAACVTLGQALTPVVNVHVFDDQRASDGARLTLPVSRAVKDAGLRFEDGCAQLLLLSDRAVSIHFFGEMPDWAHTLRKEESYVTRLQRKMSDMPHWPLKQLALPVTWGVAAVLAGGALGYWSRA